MLSQICHIIREIRQFQQAPYRIEHQPKVSLPNSLYDLCFIQQGLNTSLKCLPFSPGYPVPPGQDTSDGWGYPLWALTEDRTKSTARLIIIHKCTHTHTDTHKQFSCLGNSGKHVPWMYMWFIYQDRMNWILNTSLPCIHEVMTVQTIIKLLNTKYSYQLLLACCK